MSSVEPTPKPSTESKLRIPKVLVDADVLVAGAFSTTGASHLVLRLGELSILECLAPVQVKVEAERNLRYKLPAALATFQALIQRALTFMPDPSVEEVTRFLTQAHPHDASILAAAVLNDCHYLVTFNTRHYYPDSSTSVMILTPGKFLQHLREAISQLARSQAEE